MKLYNPHSYGSGTIFCSPGTDHPEQAEWVHKYTKVPIMFTVKFRDGVAEVDPTLGLYLIDQGLATRTPSL